jgi:hypothetical protein
MIIVPTWLLDDPLTIDFDYDIISTAAPPIIVTFLPYAISLL